MDVSLLNFKFGRPRDTEQGKLWDQQVKPGAVAAATTFLARPDVHAAKNPVGTHFLKHPQNPKLPVIGSAEQVAAKPYWNRKGVVTGFHVDHIWEYQLGGSDAKTNFWLLEQREHDVGLEDLRRDHAPAQRRFPRRAHHVEPRSRGQTR
jgi:hypothetical protein